MVPSLKNEGTISECLKSPQNFKKKFGMPSIRFRQVIPLLINSWQNPLENQMLIGLLPMHVQKTQNQ